MKPSNRVNTCECGHYSHISHTKRGRCIVYEWEWNKARTKRLLRRCPCGKVAKMKKEGSR